MEIGFTADLQLADCIQATLDQRSQLRSHLMGYGWADVQVPAHILGFMRLSMICIHCCVAAGPRSAILQSGYSCTISATSQRSCAISS